MATRCIWPGIGSPYCVGDWSEQMGLRRLRRGAAQLALRRGGFRPSTDERSGDHCCAPFGKSLADYAFLLRVITGNSLHCLLVVVRRNAPGLRLAWLR